MNTIKEEFSLMLAPPSKRLNIIRYFSFHFFSWLVMFAPSALYLALFSESDAPILLSFIFFSFMGVVVIFIFLLNIVWLVRRLHDADLSGFWLLVPILLGIVPIIYGFKTMNSVFVVAVLSVMQLLYFVMVLIPGSKTANYYGEPLPKNNFFNYTFFVLFLLFIAAGIIIGIVLN